MGTGRLKNLAFINRAMGACQSCYEVVESDSRPKRLAIGGVADVKEEILFCFFCVRRVAVGPDSYRSKF